MRCLTITKLGRLSEHTKHPIKTYHYEKYLRVSISLAFLKSIVDIYAHVKIYFKLENDRRTVETSLFFNVIFLYWNPFLNICSFK